MSDTITFNFFCPKCEGAITWPEDATDETPIICNPCGETYGTYGDLRERAMEEAKAKVSAQFRDAFKGLKNWKLS